MTAIVHDVESDLSMEEAEDKGQGDEAADEREIIREEVEGEDDEALEVHWGVRAREVVVAHEFRNALLHGLVEWRVVGVERFVTWPFRQRLFVLS